MRRAAVWALALALAATYATSAKASPELRTKLADLADKILKHTQMAPVRIGQFTPINLPDANSGPGIESVLAQELNRISKDIVQQKAAFEINGTFTLIKSDENPAFREVAVRAKLYDGNGDEVANFQARLDGNNSIAEITQVTASLPPEGAKAERNKELWNRVQDPQVFIAGTQIKATANSPYAVEILAKHKDSSGAAAAREARDDSGRAFVELREDEIYEIRIHNNSGREVAVAITIDGLDVFHFSLDRDPKDPLRPALSHFILANGVPQNIVGWHESVKGKVNYRSFQVARYYETPSISAKSKGKTGVIHIQFSYCEPLPEGAKSVFETIQGPPREVKTKVLRYDMQPPHEFVSIRYSR